MRVEPCVCGGRIRASEIDGAPSTAVAIRVHNRSALHLRWRWAVGIETPELGGPDDPARRWPTAHDAASCDVFENAVGASATSRRVS